MRKLLSGLRGLFRRDAFDRDLDDEMRDFVERATDERADRGLSAAEANRRARAEFGSFAAVREEVRGGLWESAVDTLWRDVRLGVRMLRRSPAFSIVAIMTLAIGIGANTALFSVADTVLFKPLPVLHPDELVLFKWNAGPNARPPISAPGIGIDPASGRSWSTAFAYSALEQFSSQSRMLSGVFGFTGATSAPLAEGDVDGAPGQAVSGTYFQVLGVRPALGRLLSPDDDRAGAPLVAVISHRFWQRHFGGDDRVIGKTVPFGTDVATIIGVAPAGFAGTGQLGDDPDFFIPLLPGAPVSHSKFAEKMQQPFIWPLRIFARARPGVAPADVARELTPIFQTTAVEAWKAKKGTAPVAGLPTLEVLAGGEGLIESRRALTSSLLILAAVSGVLLLIVCVNLTNLLLARAESRRAEMALRRAIGARRIRLIRQFLTETLLMSTVGAGLGLLAAYWGKDLLLAWIARVNPGFVIEPAIDTRVLVFSTIVAVIVGIGLGVVPGVRATRADSHPLLKEHSGSARLRPWTGRAMLVAQFSLSLVLLVAAGLFVRTLRNLEHADVGFNADHLLLFELAHSAKNGPPAAGANEAIADRLGALPGVMRAAYSQMSLLGGDQAMPFLTVPGHPRDAAEDRTVYTQTVSPQFFATMEMPIVEGRAFDVADSGRKIAIVNQTLARRFFGAASAVGQHVAITKDPSAPEVDAGQLLEIVGVVRDAKYMTVREDALPTVFQPITGAGPFQFAVRTAGDPLAMTVALRGAVREVAPLAVLSDFRTQADQAALTFAQERHFALIASVFGATAILLTSLGLYGLLSYSIARRRQEIGIRLALGADRGHILRGVLGETMGLAAAGIGVGVVAAAAAASAIQNRLYGLTATDPLTVCLAAGLLCAVALCAAFLPARRAAGTDPLLALRAD